MGHDSPERPLIALAIGDPSGISPELTARLVASDVVLAAARLVVIGDPRVLADGAAIAGVSLDLEEILESEVPTRAPP